MAIELDGREPRPVNREQAVAKTYAVEIAEWVREQGWDLPFFLGAMLWTDECYRRGLPRAEVAL